MENLIDKKIIQATVMNISWERIHLSIYVHIDKNEKNYKLKDLEFYAVNNSGMALAVFDKEIIDEENVILKVNVTNNGQKKAIPKGIFRICACYEELCLAECLIEESIVDKLADFSRSFLYKGQNKAYLVRFYIADDEAALKFRFRILNTSGVGMKFPGNPHFLGQVKKSFETCFLNERVYLRIVYKLVARLYGKRKQKNVLFLTEQSNEIKSNLKAVSERMIERGLDKEYTIRYSARKIAEKNQGMMSWFKLMIKCAKSGIIFVDDHVPFTDWLLLEPDVKVIQLWHAGAGFKSSGYSRWGQSGPPGPVSGHRQYTYGIAGSKHIAHFFSEVWGINTENVIPTGMPRMDSFLDEEYRNKTIDELYKSYPMCKGKKVILFAPTYRGNNAEVAFYPYNLIDFDRLYETCGEEYVVLFKMHPWVIKDIEIPEKYADRFLDVKNYPNINDIFYITDLLITDYSSSIFEFSLMRKPMLFFAYDKIQYGYARGFHRPYEESAPGKVVYNFNDLLKAIQEKDFEFEKVETYIQEHFDYIDCNASDRVIDWLLLDKLPEKFRAEIKAVEDKMNKMTSLEFDSEE